MTVRFLVEKENVEKLKSAISEVYSGVNYSAYLLEEKNCGSTKEVFLTYTLTGFNYSTFRSLERLFGGDVLYWTIL